MFIKPFLLSSDVWCGDVVVLGGTVGLRVLVTGGPDRRRGELLPRSNVAVFGVSKRWQHFVAKLEKVGKKRRHEVHAEAECEVLCRDSVLLAHRAVSFFLILFIIFSLDNDFSYFQCFQHFSANPWWTAMFLCPCGLRRRCAFILRFVFLRLTGVTRLNDVIVFFYRVWVCSSLGRLPLIFPCHYALVCDASRVPDSDCCLCSFIHSFRLILNVVRFVSRSQWLDNFHVACNCRC